MAFPALLERLQHDVSVTFFRSSKLLSWLTKDLLQYEKSILSGGFLDRLSWTDLQGNSPACRIIIITAAAVYIIPSFIISFIAPAVFSFLVASFQNTANDGELVAAKTSFLISKCQDSTIKLTYYYSGYS